MRQTPRGFGPLLVLMLLLVVGCDLDGPTICPAVVLPAIEVEVRNAVTGQPAAAEVRGIVRDGEFSDSLQACRFTGAGTPIALCAAEERPGTYAISLERAGFESWDTTGVRPGQDACGVVTAKALARLVPTE